MPRAPKNSLRGTPKVPWEAYERHVRNVLESEGGRVNLQIQGRRILNDGAEKYEVDAYAELKVFGGARIKILIECKCHTKPVPRDVVMVLYTKLQELGAHKGMIFSTSGFQRGAVAFAKKHGIALVKLAKRPKRRTAYAVPCMPPDDYAYAGETITAFICEDRLVTRDSSDYEEPPEYDLVCVLRSGGPKPSTIIGPDNPHALREWLRARPHRAQQNP